MGQHPRLIALLMLVSSALAAVPGHADTLADIKSRGVLRCGVAGDLPGLSLKDPAGDWSGLDVDFCRAVAAAVLGHRDRLELLPIPTAERFTALKDGRVDLLSRNTTWNLSRDLDPDVTFVATLYYDGQGFMVHRNTSTLSARELSRKPVCAVAHTTGPADIRTYFERNRMELDLKEFPDTKAAATAYLNGTCYALSMDLTELYAVRAATKGEDAHRILPEMISKEPLTPVVRRGDDRWFDVVRWTLFTLVNAEEAGIDSATVDASRARARADDVRLLLDVDGRTGRLLGLDPGWSYRIIGQVGNYGEVFERNLGRGSPLGIERGANALWRDGGLMVAPPAR